MNLNWNNIMACAVIVIGLTEYVKSWDKKERLKKIYKLFPLGFSFAASLLLTLIEGFTINSFLFTGLLVLAFSILGYEAILKFVQSIIEKLKLK